MKHYTLADLTAALRRVYDAARRLSPPRQDHEIEYVEYEDITDIEEEEPGEEDYCVPI